MYLYSEKHIIKCKDTNEIITGDKYLSSKHWREIRKKVYDNCNHECVRCCSVIPIEQAVIHHRTYKRLGNEKLTDLILYCKSCHTIIHKKKREWHNTNTDLQYYIKQLSNKEKKQLLDYVKNKLIF